MGDYRSEHARSIEDPEGYWGEQAALVDWIKKPRRVLDDDHAPFYRWFPDATLNTCYNALDRHVVRGHGDRTALIYDSAVADVRKSYSYADLLEEVAAFAGALRGFGVVAGDRVVIYMPMIPEAVVGMLACARLGAVHSVVFGGFAPRELAVRIDDARPKVVLAASCGIEPTRVVEYKPIIDKALEIAEHQPDVVIVKQRPQAEAELVEPRDVDWDRAHKAGRTDPAECVEVRATDPLYVLYTSGTTGKPKGIVRDNGGHAVAMAWSLPNIYDVHEGQVWWTASDVGWVVGHSYIVYAPLITGATTVLYEGKPVGTPDAGAFWRVIAEHGVEALFTAPTAIRAVKKEDPDGKLLAGHDLGRFRTLFLAGERLDPETYHWATERLGVPVVDHWWQTETGWPIAANLRGLEPMPIKAGSPTVPVPGYQVEVLGEQGTPVPAGTEGAICIRLPLPPGTLTTLWGDDERFVASYLSAYDGYYLSGDGGLPRRGRLPVRDGPHRRRHQRRRAPPLDRLDGGGARLAPGRRRVRRHRGGRRPEGPGAARLRGAQGRRGHRPRRPPHGARRPGALRDRRGRGVQGRRGRGRAAEDPQRQDPAQDDARDRRRQGRTRAVDHRGPRRPRHPPPGPAARLTPSGVVTNRAVRPADDVIRDHSWPAPRSASVGGVARSLRP